jgi:hypothetical protein
MNRAKQGGKLLAPDPLTSYMCDCRNWHKLSGYAVAQNAMGHAVTHTCGYCGRRNTIDPDDGVTIGPLPKRQP